MFLIFLRIITTNVTYDPREEMERHAKQLEEERRRIQEKLSEIAEGQDLEKQSYISELEHIKYSNTTIITVFPEKIPSKERIIILIDTNPPILGHFYCKFGSYINSGHIYGNGSLYCNSPHLSPGTISLYLSTDKIHWTLPFTLIIYDLDSSNFFSKLFLIIFILILFYFLIKYFQNKLKLYKRGKKHKKDPLINSKIKIKKNKIKKNNNV